MHVEVDPEEDREELRARELEWKKRIFLQRERANECFNAREYQQAILLYRDLVMALTTTQVLAAKEITTVVACRLNVSACLASLSEWSKLVQETTELIDLLQHFGQQEQQATKLENQSEVMAKALYFRGFAFYSLNQFENARQDFVRGLQLVRKDADLMDGMARIQRVSQIVGGLRQAKILANERNFKEALQVVEPLGSICQQLEKDQLSCAFHSETGHLLYQLGRSTKAIDHFRKALTLLKQTQVKEQDQTSSESKRTMRDDIQFGLALSLMKAGKPHQSEAVAILVKLLETCGSDSKLLARIGQLFVQMSELTWAKESFGRCMELAKDCTKVNQEEAIDLAKETIASLLAVITSADSTTSTDLLEFFCETCRKEFPSYPWLQVPLLEKRIELGDEQEQLECTQQLLALAEQHASMADDLPVYLTREAHHFAKREQFGKAQELLERSLSLLDHSAASNSNEVKMTSLGALLVVLMRTQQVERAQQVINQLKHLMLQRDSSRQQEDEMVAQVAEMERQLLAMQQQQNTHQSSENNSDGSALTQRSKGKSEKDQPEDKKVPSKQQSDGQPSLHKKETSLVRQLTELGALGVFALLVFLLTVMWLILQNNMFI